MLVSEDRISYMIVTFYNSEGRAVAYLDDNGESIYLYDGTPGRPERGGWSNRDLAPYFDSQQRV